MVENQKTLQGRFHCIPLQWYTNLDKNWRSTKLVRSKNDQKTNKSLKIKLFVFTGTWLVVIYQTIFTQISDEDISTKIFAWLTTSILISVLIFFNELRLQSTEVATLINCLIQFDVINRKRSRRISERPFAERIRLCVTYAMLYTGTLFPIIFVFGVHWYYPWKPSLAFYWLIPKPYDLNIPEIFEDNMLRTVVKFLVCLYNYWVWGSLLESTGFVMGILLNLSTAILLDNLKMYVEFLNKQNQN